MTPEDPAEEFVKHYLLLIPSRSFADLQKVLDLKVRRFFSVRARVPDLTGTNDDGAGCEASGSE